MFASDYDDDDSPFSPSGDLEDDSLLDEVLMDSYDEDEAEPKDEVEDEKHYDLDDEDDEDLDEEEDDVPEDTNGK
jgi:hypothetical protein